MAGQQQHKSSRTNPDGDARRAGSVCLLHIGALLGAIVALLLTIPQAQADWADEIVTSDQIPGLYPKSQPVATSLSDIDSVIAVLEKILNGYREGQKPLENVLYRGRLAEAGRNWKKGEDIAFPKELQDSQSQWHGFELVEQNGTHRFIRDHVFELLTPDGKEVIRQPGKSGFLALRDAFYALDRGSLTILPMDPPSQWPMRALAVYKYTAVRANTEFAPLDRACQHYLGQLRDPTSLYRRGYSELRVFEDGVEMAVLTTQGPKAAREATYCESCFWVAPKFGYQVVRWTDCTGQRKPGQNLDNWLINRIDYHEIAPSVYVVAKASERTASVGPLEQKEGSAFWRIDGLIVDEARFGDFEYDEKQFDPASLPVPLGAYVWDKRQTPELEFRYGKAPLDEQLLQQAAHAPALAAQPSRFFWPLIVAGCLMTALVGIWLGRRRARLA